MLRRPDGAVTIPADRRIRLTLPYAGTITKVHRDHNTNSSIVAAASRAELEASRGDRYYRDAAAGLVHLKVQAQNGRDWTAYFIVG